jgi:hypothetical protein
MKNLSFTSVVLLFVALVTLAVGALHVGGCITPSELANLETMEDAEFELLAQEMEADADLATVLAVTSGAVKPEHALLFSQLLAAQPLSADPFEGARQKGQLEESLVNSLIAKVRRKIAKAGGWPLGARGQILLTRIASSIGIAAQRAAALQPMDLDGIEDRQAPLPEQQADAGVSDG